MSQDLPLRPHARDDVVFRRLGDQEVGRVFGTSDGDGVRTDVDVDEAVGAFAEWGFLQ